MIDAARRQEHKRAKKDLLRPTWPSNNGFIKVGTAQPSFPVRSDPIFSHAIEEEEEEEGE